MTKKNVEVSVMGQKFQVRSESDDTYVQRVADFVNKRVDKVIQGTQSVASVNVAILAAMNIADEYFKYKDKKTHKIKGVEEKVESLIELLDLQL